MLRVVKVRLYPNDAQKQLLSQHFGSARVAYNVMLRKSIDAHEAGEKISVYELKKLLPIMKQTDEFGWMKEVDSTALQNAVINLDKAYKHFFCRVKNGEKAGFPRLNPNTIPDRATKAQRQRSKTANFIFQKSDLSKRCFTVKSREV